MTVIVKRLALAAAAAAATAALPAAVAAPGAGAQAPPAASPLDQSWLMTSMEGDRFEIRGGRLALKNSSSPAVRRLGRTLVRDHTKSYREAAAAARALGIEPQDSPSPSQVWELSVLNGLRGARFDRQYASLEVQDHKQDIQETGFEAGKGNDPSVVALARSDLPVLRRHLALSRRALRRGA